MCDCGIFILFFTRILIWARDFGKVFGPSGSSVSCAFSPGPSLLVYLKYVFESLLTNRSSLIWVYIVCPYTNISQLILAENCSRQLEDDHTWYDPCSTPPPPPPVVEQGSYQKFRPVISQNGHLNEVLCICDKAKKKYAWFSR